MTHVATHQADANRPDLGDRIDCPAVHLAPKDFGERADTATGTNIHSLRSDVTDATDDRFAKLLPAGHWQRLPASIRRRFSKRIGDGEMTLYAGHVTQTSMTVGGRVLANLARLIGSPLPLTPGATGPALVTVTEDHRLGGQVWTRTYARAGRFAQVVHSTKRFTGATGLEEYVGRGVGMALNVHVDDKSLVFTSAWYFVQVFGRKFRLPQMLSPGRMQVVHREEGCGVFSFTLTLVHHRFGNLLRQVAMFKEVVPC